MTTVADRHATGRGARADDLASGPAPAGTGQPHARPNPGRSALSIATSVGPLLGLWVLMYLAFNISYLLVLVLAVPTIGFMLRTYILFHDCAHGSLLRHRRANAWLGAALGLLVITPFARWRHEHARHHATAGDLDRRGIGDIHTLTAAEYRARSWPGRLGYRLFRNPLVMFGLGPLWGMLLAPRWIRPSARWTLQRSVWGTNLALLVTVGSLVAVVGWRPLVLVYGPAFALAGAAGIWLFYVQHQFHRTYWRRSTEWSAADAALAGSSYLRLPKVLQFFTGSIGLHHVHHLNPRIPSYRLQRTLDSQSSLAGVPAISLRDGLRAVRLKVWDEDAERLVTWKEHRNGWRARS